MSDLEFRLFDSCLRHCETYVEFGSGGSTYVAACTAGTSVIAVDSSREWLDNVEIACAGEECRVKPNLVHADIGPIGEWGFPADASTMDRWPYYYEHVWANSASYDADMYLVDGRLRVACFMEVLRHCRPDSTIFIHDFASRSYYHVVREVAREIASAEEMSVFIAKPGQGRRIINDILIRHRHDAR
jgi:hypothetical protein